MRFSTKFRAWNPAAGGFTLPFSSIGNGYRELLPVEGHELSACTEIPDKNGRLIWTGDILRGPFPSYDGKDPIVDVNVEDDPSWWEEYGWKHMEVVGNKWEGISSVHEAQATL